MCVDCLDLRDSAMQGEMGCSAMERSFQAGAMLNSDGDCVGLCPTRVVKMLESDVMVS